MQDVIATHLQSRDRLRSAALAGGVCVLLLSVFAALAWNASKRESPTVDESLHASSAYVQSRQHDFRADPEGSAFWKYWAMLPQPASALRLEQSDEAWMQIPQDHEANWRWCNRLLYGTPPNDGPAFVQRSRAMMLVIGVLLGLLIALWAGQLGGPVAAMAATTLYALDPNFIAHAPLVKNDVIFTALFLAVVYVLWLLGRRLTFTRVLALCIACGIAVTTKFSGVALLGLVPLLLAMRGIDGSPWRWRGAVIAARGRKLLAAGVVFGAIAVVTWVTIWAVYQFRFTPTPDPSIRFDLALVVDQIADNETATRDIHADPRAWKPGLLISALLVAERHKLLPHSWVYGLLFTHAASYYHPAFLLDERRSRGWAWYFPLAMAFKTPLATIAVIAAAGGLLVYRRFRGVPSEVDRWTRLCLLLPPMLYGLMAINMRLNIGLRHIFPVYPFLFIVSGAVFAKAMRSRPRFALAAGLALGAGLAAETLGAFPHYIAFFNAPSAPWRIHLLGDSNLDWGQDLPLLKKWQDEHPDRKLYLCYFGTADPAFYGIRHTPLVGSLEFGREGELPKEPGVLAFCATHVQGIYWDGGPIFPIHRELLRGSKPFTVLGHSIYLYEFAGSK